jgi:EAL domain-containing protein (putative c-di-GMP-specific phosphodiesterase class I)
MRRADLALSIAKDEGGARTIVFDRSMEATLEATRMRFAELSDAIAKEQLVLVYQPTFDLATRAVTGAEALVRWDHPERGRVAPSEFVPFAERNGLIGQLTRWVFQRVRRDISGGVSLPHGFRVYFNVVAQTLDDLGFIAEVNDALRTTPNLASHIGIELTESAAMQNIESAMHTINILRKWGLSVAVDDFGTGYSSLSYLKKLTVDVIKIDRSFVVGLPDDERDGAITELLLQITDRFGVATLAEGIETEAQAQWLVRHGCRYGQGFLLAKPDSFAALQERLRESPTVAASAAVSG